MSGRQEQSDEKGAPVAHVVTEYALAHDVGHGLVLATGPLQNPRWDETITPERAAERAAERWFPGAIVVTRTVTTFEPVVTDWSRVTRPGKPSGGESRCCPGAGSMAHVRGCHNHPEAP